MFPDQSHWALTDQAGNIVACTCGREFTDADDGAAHWREHHNPAA